MVERLVKGDGFDRRGHEFRYRLASGFVDEDTGIVLDAACGTGYGMEWLYAHGKGDYRGVDRDLSALEVIDYDWQRSLNFIEADLDTWVPDFFFDVFVCFETIEHVKDPVHLIQLGAQARRWMILSVPIVPTKHVNKFHLHDFEPGWLERVATQEPGWRHYQTVQQPSEFSEVAVFERIK